MEGACVCGSTLPSVNTRVIPLIGAKGRGCEKHGYVHLVAVPIRLQGKVQGEVDLLYKKPFHPTVAQKQLLETLGSHLATAFQDLKKAALGKEAAISEERTLLARELHDSISQSLAFLKIQVQLLRSALLKKEEEKVAKVLDELEQGVRESIADVRELLVHFRIRPHLDSMDQVIHETLQKFQLQTGLGVDCKITGSGLNLPQDVQVHVLHILQEALSNVRKHARTTKVAVTVEKDQIWRFTVEDDGVGFDPGVERSSLQIGLGVMQERSTKINGRLSVSSVVGKGTRVFLEVPLLPQLGTWQAQ